MNKTLATILAAGLCVTGQAAAAVIYNNLGANGFQAPFTPAGPDARLPGVSFTGMFADDVTPAVGGPGWIIDKVQYEVENTSSVNVRAATGISFWDASGTGGGPGTLLFAGAGATLDLTPGFNSLLIFPAAPMPSGPFWVGFNFTNLDDTTVAPALLNSLRLGVRFAPNSPSAGSTNPGGFYTTGAGLFDGNDPAGLITPNVNNLSMLIEATAPIPEPATWGLAGMALVAIAIRGRNG